MSNKHTLSPDKDQVALAVMKLADDDPRLVRVAAALTKADVSVVENLQTFSAMSRDVGYHESWLRRLGVHKRCAISLAGGKRYRRSEVLDYLSSEECKIRVEEIRSLKKKAGVQ